MKQDSMIGGGKCMHENVLAQMFGDHHTEEPRWVRLLKREAETMKVSQKESSRQMAGPSQSLGAATHAVTYKRGWCTGWRNLL